MPLCAYCDQEKYLVRENLIPAWFYEHQSAWDEPPRARGWTVRTDLQVDDVCQECYDQLTGPARYAEKLFREQLVHYLYRDTAQGFAPDYEMLLRWLLRISYDSARLHGEEQGILAQYRDVMKGQVAPTADATLLLRTITPTALEEDGFMASGSATHVGAHPDWLRIGVLGVDNMGCLSWCFRQVTINSYSFLLLLKDPERVEDANEERLANAEVVDNELAGAAWLEPGSNIWTPVPWNDALGATLLSVGCFHLGCELLQSKAIAEGMGTQEPIKYWIERHDIEAGDISHALAFLCELVATKETCLRMQQRVEFVVAGYEDDPLPYYERPEVLSFLRALDQSFPYWMFFQHPEGRWINQLSVLLGHPLRNESGKFQLDAQLLGQVVRNWFTWLYELCYRYGIDEGIADGISDKAKEILL